MQSLFLKSLVLIGVVGGGCFAVWRAHESLQADSSSSDPHHFTALESSDLSEDLSSDASDIIDESASVNLVTEIDSSKQSIEPTLAPKAQTESNDLEPTPAKPWNLEPTLASKDDGSNNTVPGAFPSTFIAKGTAKPIAEASNTTPDKESPQTLPTSPVMPSSYYSASGNEVPSVKIPSGSDEIIQVGATQSEGAEQSAITQAGYESAPGGNDESNSTLVLPDQHETEIPSVLPIASPNQPENRFGPQSKDDSDLAPGLTKLPPSYPGPVLLKPSSLPTLGQPTLEANNDSENSTIPLPIKTSNATDQNLPAPTPSADLENPFSKFSVLPSSNEPGPTIPTNDPVLPEIPSSNPFEKFENRSIKTTELEPALPADAGFNTTPPMPSIPEVKENPFANNQNESVLPSESNASVTSEPVPSELLPPMGSEVLPSGTVELPTTETPSPLSAGAFPSNLKNAERVPPKMVEPEPLLPIPAQISTASDTPPNVSGLPEVLPTIESTLPKIRPSIDRAFSQNESRATGELSAGTTQPGMPIISPGRPREAQPIPEPAKPNFSGDSSELLPTPVPVVNRETPNSFPPLDQTESGRVSPVANEVQAETDAVLPSNFKPDSAPALTEPTTTPDAITTIPDTSPTPTSTIPPPLAPEFPLEQSVPQPATEQIPKSEVANTVNERLEEKTIDPVVASGPQSPELKIEKIAPPQATIGEPLIYSIRVRNVGNSEARKVVVEDRIPRGTKLSGTIPQAVMTNDKLTWDLGNIKPEDERIIKLKVVPMEAGEIGSVATVSFESAISATIRVTAPELKVDIEGPTETLLGKNVPYQFTVRNNGDGDAKDVVLRALLPPSLKHPNGDDIEADLGTIPAGQTKTVNLVVVADAVGVSTPKVLIWMNGKNYAENQADLRILKSRLRISRTGPKRRFVGRSGQFVTQITNDSSTPLSNIKVEEHIPVSLDLATFVKGWNPQRRVIERAVPLLQPGETRNFTTQLVPNQAGELVSKLVAHDQAGNHVEVAAPLSVKGFADLEANVFGKDKVVAIGDQVSLRLKLKNSGTASAMNVQAAFEIPQGFTFTAASGPSSYEVIENRVIFEEVDEIPSADEQSYDIVLTAAEVCTDKVKIKLSSADYSEPIHLEEPVRVILDEE